MTRTSQTRRRPPLGRGCSIAALLVLLPLTGYAQAAKSLPPPPDAPAISVTAELVVLPVRVLDKDGVFVSGLRAGNFRIYENGRLQTINLFQQEDAPVTVGLIVDHSRSMSPKLKGVAAAVISFAHSSNPQDEMFVVDFNDNVSLESLGGKPFTHDAGELAQAVAAVSARGQTALYDAVYAGINHLQLAHRDKKALIVVSDGGDDASKHTLTDVLALARRSQTVIYSIGLVGGGASEEEDPKVLRRLCDETGGVAIFPEAAESVSEVSTRIAQDLREQYTLGFAPESADSRDSYRKIQVKVSAPGHGKLRVQTRPGYVPPQKLAKDPR